MGFATLDDKDCLIRKPLAKFKWNDIADVINGQTLNSNAKKSVEEAVEGAKADGKIDQPYVKVGVVKKNLIFRIKHKGGHFGDDDVIVVKNFDSGADSNGNDDTSLFGKIGKVELTPNWWDGVSQNIPNRDTLGTPLIKLDYNRRLTTTKPSFGAFRILDESLQDAQDGARTLAAKLGHKDDKEVMAKIMKACREESESLTGKVVPAYTKKLEAAIDERIENLVKGKLKQIQGQLTDLIKTIKAGDLDTANRDSARVSKAIISEPMTDGGSYKTVMKDLSTEKEWANEDVEEIYRLAAKRPARLKLRAEFKKLPAAYAKVMELFDEQEAKLDQDPEYDHPENSTSNDNTYKQKLKTVNSNYKSVLNAIDQAHKISKQRTGLAKSFAASCAKTPDQASLLQVAQTLTNQLETTMQNTVAEYSKIRNNSGEYRAEVKASPAISAEDEKKFLTTILNKCMRVWYNYRNAERQVYELLEEGLEAIVGSQPAAQTVLTKVQNHLGASGD